MKGFIFFINILTVILTIILHFIDRSSGLLAQLVLAFFQLLFALAYTVAAFKNKNTRFMKLLGIYWFLVAVFFILARTTEHIFKHEILLIVLPMTIACYFAYLTYVISKTADDYEY